MSNTVRWTTDLILRLIDEYEAPPCLCDIFSNDYHNRDELATRLTLPARLPVKLLSTITNLFSRLTM